MSDKISRRNFTIGAAAVGAGLAVPKRARAKPGAADKIRLGFIGVANRGGQLLDAAIVNNDIEVVGLCDVHKPPLEKWAMKLPGARTYGDFRKMIERKDIDAIVIATPDHWHAIMAITACDAGKDVYCEKPLTITIHEGRRMVEAARRNKRIVQMGVQRRSSTLYPKIVKLVQEDGIGKVTVARSYRLSNMFPNGIGIAPDSEPPPDLDWDMWLGPRPKRPFNVNIAPYKFRWWKAYSSQLGNWGVHYFDVIRWIIGEEAPVSVSAHGGKFAVNDSRDIPDTLEVTYEFASGRLMVFGQYEASGQPAMAKGEIELRGTNGVLYADIRKFEVIPEIGGQFADKEPRIKPIVFEGGENDRDLDKLHMRNFLDCVKSRKTPNCDVEDGHRSTTFAHLGNIALATKSRIEWDAKEERITNNAKANDLLHYTYRAPWKLG